MQSISFPSEFIKSRFHKCQFVQARKHNYFQEVLFLGISEIQFKPTPHSSLEDIS